MRCRLYVDEVGNGDLKGSATDDNARYLSLTGISTSVAVHGNRFQPELDALKAKYFGHSAQNPIILHRRDVMNRKGPFAVLHNADTRDAFNADLLKLLKDLPYRVITVTIDKRQHLQQYGVWQFDPYHYCMTCLVERYVRWLDDAGSGFEGDAIVEARNKTPDKKLKASYARLHKLGTDNVSAQMMASRLTSRELKLSPKTDNIAGLQIADAIAHPIFRDMKHRAEGVSRPQDFGGQIASLMEADKIRRGPSPKRALKGYGLKWLP